MTAEHRTSPRGPRKALTRLSAPVLGVVGVLILAGVSAGGYYAYRTYDFVQHDNDFCMSCHLMQQPFERFAVSAHRGLGCKACHQPTLMARSQMALTQIIENPDELSVHAEVPNGRCAECHIEGDPERWRRTANTIGHRIHLESTDPALQGLKCVECHSSSVHEFAAVDRTCGQSGCHEDVRIRLAGMSDLTIHCAACHYFLAPAEPEAGMTQEVRNEIRPDRETCLSCHAMRALVELPDPDPHGGECGSCHNPHEQDEPRDAAQSCATVGCHVPGQMATPFHRGLRPSIVEDCAACHRAHDFALDGSDCRLCHKGLEADSLVLPGSGAPPSAPAVGRSSASGITEAARPTGAGATSDPTWYAHRAAESDPSFAPASYLHGDDEPTRPALRTASAVPLPPQTAPASRQAVTFRHAQHQDLDCSNCHTSRDQHSEITVTTLADCRSCHHTEPVARACARCHDASDQPAGALAHEQTVTFSFGREERRDLPFRHDAHQGLDCSRCHTEGLARSAEPLDCASCHEDHHTPETDCASCHRQAPAAAHPPAEAHVTCSGSGCHQDVPFGTVPRTRAGCLVCHQDLAAHQPARICTDCHRLPAPRGGGLP